MLCSVYRISKTPTEGTAAGEVSIPKSCAQVVVALTSLGIDPAEDSRFIKNGNSVLDALLGYYVNGGGLNILTVNLKSTLWPQSKASTSRILQQDDRKSSLYDMSDIDREEFGFRRHT